MASQNTNNVLDTHAWARKTARRLRVAYASFSDQTFDEKKAYLEDELEFSLADAGAESGELREKLLDNLAASFPVYGGIVAEEVKAPVVEDKQTQPIRSQADLQQDVIDMWGRADSYQRQAILTALNATENTNDPDMSSPSVSSNEQLSGDVTLPFTDREHADFKRGISLLWKVLKVSDPKPAHMGRLIKLLGMLASTYGQLHKVLWEFWDLMVPREMKDDFMPDSSESFEKLISRYLSGDEGMNSGAIAKEVDRIKLMILSLCFAVRKGAEEFGRVQYERLSPDNLENAVMIEDSASSSTRIKDLERKAWMKYRQLAKHLTAESVDEEFQQLFGRVMAVWLKSR